MKQGLSPVAGVDEAGRGPLAGPVVAAAVVLNPEAIPNGLDDSKRLTIEKRNALFDALTATAWIGVASAPSSRIDEMNILAASLWAMSRAVEALAKSPAAVLIDGNKMPTEMATGFPYRGEAIVKGDQRSQSIAAASIVAKVTRDRMMVELDDLYPHYGLASNKGYPTKDHRAALLKHGAAACHRRSFAPVKAVLQRA